MTNTSFLSFSLRFLILQVFRFTMRDWLALPLTGPVDEAIARDDEESSVPSWFTILNIFSAANKMTKREIPTQDTTQDDNTLQPQEDDEEDEEDDEEAHLSRTFSSSSIATSTNTEHSTPANSQIKPDTSKFYHELISTKMTNVKIRWNHGGNKVQVTGEFDNWSVSVTMMKEKDYHIVEIPMDLTKDIEFKFVVDGEWKYADDLPHRSDWCGNINNVIYKK